MSQEKNTKPKWIPSEEQLKMETSDLYTYVGTQACIPHIHENAHI